MSRASRIQSLLLQAALFTLFPAKALGIDRDADGVLDGDEIPPALASALSDGGIQLFWQTSRAGAVLEPGAPQAPALLWASNKFSRRNKAGGCFL